jgi:hypothetical protein
VVTTARQWNDGNQGAVQQCNRCNNTVQDGRVPAGVNSAQQPNSSAMQPDAAELPAVQQCNQCNQCTTNYNSTSACLGTSNGTAVRPHRHRNITRQQHNQHITAITTTKGCSSLSCGGTTAEAAAAATGAIRNQVSETERMQWLRHCGTLTYGADNHPQPHNHLAHNIHTTTGNT